MTDQTRAWAGLMDRILESTNLDRKTPIDATAWFLGPKAENAEALLKLVKLAAESQIEIRRKYQKDDPPIFEESDEAHQNSLQIIERELRTLLDQLRSSIPLASYRNQSHMYWDITLPGAVGYFAAMLYNQNNVATEASPVTTLLELEVGKDLCRMLGFAEKAKDPDDPLTEPIRPWGHITCDGSVANGESMWAARNLKYLPPAVCAALQQEEILADARDISVKTSKGGRAKLVDLSVWQQLNLPVDEVVGLYDKVVRASGLQLEQVKELLDPYTLPTLGMIDYRQRYLESASQAMPVALVPDTAHYSWAKTGSLLGLGFQAVRHIEVDLDGRMDMVALRRELEYCRSHGHPVIQVVAVMGSTEEGAVDPLREILSLREEFAGLGLGFVVHVDGAWGGYFKSILQPPDGFGTDPAEIIERHPELYLGDHFREHFEALPYIDTITLDPHKSGFIPYPAGSLCYRNGEMRQLIAYNAPVVSHGNVDVTVGTYGIEGSKPGAAAASVYLSHKCIPLDKSGYGRMLGRCLFNSKRLYAALVSMDLDENFRVVPFQRLPIERDPCTPEQIIAQKKYLHETIVTHSTPKLINHVFGLNHPEQERNDEQREALRMFQQIGSDLSIIAYAFNFKTRCGWNQDQMLMNELNDRIFRALSMKPEDQGKLPKPDMFITASKFDPAIYGDRLVNNFCARAGVEPVPGQPLRFLISTTQNPWLSSAVNDINMIDVLIEVLRKTVEKERKSLVKKYDLDKHHGRKD